MPCIILVKSVQKRQLQTKACVLSKISAPTEDGTSSNIKLKFCIFEVLSFDFDFQSDKSYVLHSWTYFFILFFFLTCYLLFFCVVVTKQRVLCSDIQQNSPTTQQPQQTGVLTVSISSTMPMPQLPDAIPHLLVGKKHLGQLAVEQE